MSLLTKVVELVNLKYLAVGFTGVALIGYSAYFDYKRTTAPSYKNEIRRRRKLQAEMKQREIEKFNEFPNPMNKAASQQFMLEQFTRGEELMARGNVEEGVAHLANAVMISDRPNDLVSIMQQTIPPLHFLALTQALPAAKQRYDKAKAKFFGGDEMNLWAAGEASGGQRVMLMDDDDLE